MDHNGDAEHYDFVFDDRYRPLLAVLGIRPERCRLTVTVADPDRLAERLNRRP